MIQQGLVCTYWNHRSKSPEPLTTQSFSPPRVNDLEQWPLTLSLFDAHLLWIKEPAPEQWGLGLWTRPLKSQELLWKRSMAVCGRKLVFRRACRRKRYLVPQRPEVASSSDEVSPKRYLLLERLELWKKGKNAAVSGWGSLRKQVSLWVPLVSLLGASEANGAKRDRNVPHHFTVVEESSVGKVSGG